MKLILLFLSFLTVVTYYVYDARAGGIDARWKTFKAEYGKSYSKGLQRSVQDIIRKKIFKSRWEAIKAFNKRYSKGLESFEKGTNQLTDMKPNEIARFTRDLVLPLRQPRAAIEIKSAKQLGLTKGMKIPKSIDWREKGFVSPVKDQRMCGSSWAFAVTGALESQIRIAAGPSSKFLASEQQLLDCNIKSHGCKGGWMTDAYDYIRENGITSNAKYLYQGKSGTCLYKPKEAAVKIKGFAKVAKGDEKLLAETVAAKGPVAVGIDASGPFRAYKSGLYYNPKCDPTRITHGVLVVGYGTENGLDYWLVKNSWGKKWGDNGYIKMARNSKNNCGIASEATYPILLKSSLRKN